jgi:hypothetical protein
VSLLFMGFWRCHGAVCERCEEPASVEDERVGHWSGFVCLLLAARPARSSAATVFQLNASSKRSAIGRCRAARSVPATASGSRTSSATGGPVAGVGSSGDLTGPAYRHHASSPRSDIRALEPAVDSAEVRVEHRRCSDMSRDGTETRGAVAARAVSADA